MFNMNEIGKKISQKRKELNMTQMEMADKIGVTHQAVSSWEKGSTMPDIGKLEDLSNLLNISIDDLLGSNRNSRIVEEIVEKEVELKEVNIKDLAQIAPILKPTQIEEAFQNNKSQNINIEDIILLAPHLDEEEIDELLMNLSNDVSVDKLVGICPFASEKGIAKVAEKLKVESLKSIVPLAPFMDEVDLSNLVLNNLDVDNVDGIVALAPFMDEHILGEVAIKIASKQGIKSIMPLIPFIDDGIIKKLYKKV